MKRILVPTDFSPAADTALKYAMELARPQNARITILNAWENIYPVIEPVSGLVAEQIDMGKYSKEGLKKLLHDVKEQGLDVGVISQEGAVVNSIVHTAENKKADIIVMGTDGASGLQRFFLGTNTARVIEKATCPVIAVPGKTKFQGIKKIVYAIDYLKSDRQSLQHLAEIARVFDSEITLFHIIDFEDSTKLSQTTLDLFTKRVIKETGYEKIYSRVVKASGVEEKLNEYVDRKNADLFVMSTRKHLLFDRLFGKSLTKRMAYHSKMPLMAYHHKETAVTFI